MSDICSLTVAIFEKMAARSQDLLLVFKSVDVR
jgi:hypothetical protein